MAEPGRFERLKTQVRKLRLPLLGLFILMLGLLLAILDMYFQQDRAARLQSESLLLSQTRDNALHLSLALERQMDAVQTAAAALSAFDDLQGVTARTTLRSYLGESELVSMWVADRDGFAQDPSGNTRDFSGSDIVNEALLGRAGWSAAWQDPSTGQVLFCACAPVRRAPNAPVSGAVVGMLTTERLCEIADLASFDTAGYVAATQPDGLVLYYSKSLGTRLAGHQNFWDYADPGSYVPEGDLRALMEAGDEGLFYYRSPYRGRVASCCVRIGIGDWYLFQDVPENVMMRGNLNFLLLLLQLAAKLLVCSFVLIFCLARYHRQREGAVEQAEASLQLTNQSLEIALTHATINLFLYDVYSRTLTAHQFTNDKGGPMVLENGPAQMVQRGAVAPQHASTFLGLFHQIKSGMPTVQADLLLRAVGRADYIWNRVILTTVFDKYRSATHAIVTFEDISEERRREEELAQRAHKDPLTGLYNREGLRARVNALRCSAGRPATGAFLLLDLDHFKEVNDTLGHPAGDRLLREAAHVLEGLCPEGGACARIGGDEFVLLAPGLGWQEAEELAGHVCRRIPLLAATLELRVPVGISVGVHVFECASAHLDAVYQEADVALYAAKRERGRWVATRGLNVAPSV
ncbi:diguanylate cyclase domain-containing protein [Allofournierella sp.]|uniref:sensor domain-containing diguanylate cyclase n=1 Tax=Allofournierella sp. TaxID=1940256 RepID=UPI003AB36C04